MKPLTTAIGLTAAIAVWIAPPAASAESTESVVPPENSAATQYTEALPTAGGNKESGGGGGKGHRSPAKVLGAHNAHQLESHGKQGREVAEVVAETAPSTAAPNEGQQAPRPEEAQQSGKAKGTSHPPHRDEAGQSPSHDGSPPEQSAATSELPSGSSGLGEVLASAVGTSSSGQLGALLPLAIVAVIAWAIAYLLRQRRRTG